MLERITQESREITDMRKSIAEACPRAVGEETEFGTHREWLSLDRSKDIFSVRQQEGKENISLQMLGGG